MIIDYTNKELIESKKIHLHDDFFYKFYYNIKENIISIETLTEDKTKKRIIEFFNVLAFQMMSYSNEEDSEIINCWQLSEPMCSDALMQTVLKDKIVQNVNGLRIESLDKCIESKIHFISCDSLTIICESIRYEVIPYVDKLRSKANPLVNAVFKHIKYTENFNNRLQNCAICRCIDFSSGTECYITDDSHYLICDSCFNRFKDMYKWKVLPES